MKINFLLLSMLIWLTYAAGVLAANTPSPVSPPTAPVTLDGNILFYMPGFKTISPQLRAERIADRIKMLAEEPYFEPEKITFVSDQISTDVMAGDTIIVSVLENDAVALGKDRAELAKQLGDQIRSAIIDYREKHSIQNLLLGALFALITTLLLIGFFYLLSRLFKLFELRFDAFISQRLASTRIRVFEFLIERTAFSVLKLIRLLIGVGGLYIYFSVILSFFPWTRTIANHLFGFLLDPIKQMGSDLWNQMPNFIFLLILALIVRFVLRVMYFFFNAIENGDVEFAEFYPEWAIPTYKISRILVLIFGLVIAYPYIPGSDSRAFQGISLFLGVLFSIGSTSVVANMVAGVILTYMRGFRVGDVVKIGDTIGRVTEVSLLVTRIRTPKNLEITMPNSLLMNNPVTNYSFAASEGRLIIPVSITIGYDAPWRQVHALLLLAAERTVHVLNDPAPFVLQTGLDDFYVKYELNVYLGSCEDMPRIYSELHRNIQDAFNEFGVQIMSPHYLADPQIAKIVPKEHWHQPPAESFKP